MREEENQESQDKNCEFVCSFDRAFSYSVVVRLMYGNSDNMSDDPANVCRW